MPGVTRDAIVRGCSPKELYDVVVDYPSYPQFFKDFTGCTVLSEEGNTQTVEFRAKVVKEVAYTLKIEHDPEGFKTSWTFVRGTLITDSKGGWTFSEVDGGARIDYHAEIEVNAPLPGFVKRKIQDAILNRSIGPMFQQLEAEARRRR